jgi:N-acetylglucosaminyl-diphospho-decaprenol L-rhamnosyltransferase
MQGSPELSIIYVNWNSLEYLRESLASIYSTSADVRFEVIVVDNASAVDETVAIGNEFPQVRTIWSEKNLGFAGANNLGSESALGRYLLFLNPDTRVLGAAIANMLKQLKSTPGGGAIGCRLLNSDGSIQTSCIQRFPTIMNQLLDLEFLRSSWPMWKFWGIAPLFSETPSPVEVEVISGACLMVTQDAFQNAGRFNEDYFMYAEDVDLCYQVGKSGRQTLYTSAGEVIHHGGGTSKSRKGNAWVAVMQREAILKFCRATRGRWYAVGYRAAMAVNAACRLIFLAVTFPFRQVFLDKGMVHSNSSKWVGVLKWALGLNHYMSSVRSNA